MNTLARVSAVSTVSAVLLAMAAILLPITSGCNYQPMGDPSGHCYRQNRMQ